MATSLIGLGSNLGQRTATIDSAVQRLDAHPKIRVTASSAGYETDPIGGPTDQPAFINSAVRVDTDLPPRGLLAALHEVEDQLGRQRDVRWQARTIDLDLLLYEDVVLATPALTVPHPRMSFRRFVLEPACKIAAEMMHPVCGWSLQQLLDHVRLHQNYVAIAGPLGAGKTSLAGQVCQRLNLQNAAAAQLISEQFDERRLDALYKDPASHAWDVEIEFLSQRSDLLGTASWPDTESNSGNWLISDFWFDQSLAYASVWLDEAQNEAYRKRWEQARQSVITPKLLVVLTSETEELAASVARRNRSCEKRLSNESIEKIRTATQALTSLPGHGPVLQLASAARGEEQQAIEEVVAAVRSMQ